MENIFTFQGKLGHEIVFVYELGFENQALYKKEAFYGQDDEENKITASWQNIKDFENRQLILYPEVLLELIQS